MLRYLENVDCMQVGLGSCGRLTQVLNYQLFNVELDNLIA